MELPSNFAQLMTWVAVITIVGGGVVAAIVLGWQLFAEALDVSIPQTQPEHAVWAVLRAAALILGFVFILAFLIVWRLSL